MDLRRKAMECFHQYDLELLGYIQLKDFEELFKLLINNKLINPNIFCESVKIKLGLLEENCDKLLIDIFIAWLMMVIYIIHMCTLCINYFDSFIIMVHLLCMLIIKIL